MAPPTPQQQLRRARFEGLIGVAAPFLDLVLVAGDRLSRIVSPDDDYIPVRPPAEALQLGSSRPTRTDPPGPSREIAD